MRSGVWTSCVPNLHVSLAQEDADWYPSKYGADDTLGAINNLSEQGTVKAAKLVKTGKVYPLGVLTGWATPAYPPRTYSITILDGPGTGATQGENKTSGNDDLLVPGWVSVVNRRIGTYWNRSCLLQRLKGRGFCWHDWINGIVGRQIATNRYTRCTA